MLHTRKKKRQAVQIASALGRSIEITSPSKTSLMDWVFTWLSPSHSWEICDYARFTSQRTKEPNPKPNRTPKKQTKERTNPKGKKKRTQQTSTNQTCPKHPKTAPLSPLRLAVPLSLAPGKASRGRRSLIDQHGDPQAAPPGDESGEVPAVAEVRVLVGW